MRPIKFRAISKLKKEPTFEFTLEELMRGQVSIGYPEHWYFLEFTGLLDKNGKEIYEGDIVEGTTFKEPIILKTETRIKAVVDFSRGAFHAWSFVDLPKGFRTLPSLTDNDIEVIGNIYENLELLS
jgi:uncharacterized phage protein (TIGR01671 family)